MRVANGMRVSSVMGTCIISLLCRFCIISLLCRFAIQEKDAPSVLVTKKRIEKCFVENKAWD